MSCGDKRGLYDLVWSLLCIVTFDFPISYAHSFSLSVMTKTKQLIALELFRSANYLQYNVMFDSYCIIL